MPNKYNPFRPDKMAPPGMFCGRMEELTFIDHCLLQTKNGNPQHFLMEGERGIGKSSLFLCEYAVATGGIPTFSTETKLDFIVISISLQENDDYYSIIRKLMAELKKQLGERSAFKKFGLAAWDFITRFEAAGVRYNRDAKDVEESELLSHLQADLVKLIGSLEKEADGILLLVDEADKPPPEAHLGLICKLLTEELSRKSCDRLCIGLAGLPDIIPTLRQSHESSPRIFKTMSLKPLEVSERKRVIDLGLEEASKKNGFKIIITPEAKNLISNLSEGYPHFLQEFAYCAFEEDTDNVIDRADVFNSLFKENGPFEQLGRKFFVQFYAAPSSDDYRKVLNTMAEHFDHWVDRASIIAESRLKEGTVDNALRALRKQKIILKDETRTGQYRLPTKAFAVWIRVRQAAATEAASNGNGPGLFEENANEGSTDENI
jgi:hypothetical protein